MSISSNNLTSIDPASLAEGQRVIIIDGTAYVAGTGGGGSGSGAFDLAKVTEYIPYAPEVTAVTSVVVSGMGVIADEEDVTAANGTYLVTADTAAETNWKKRVYKHESADYYLDYYIPSDMPEEAMWQFKYGNGSEFAVLYSSEDIASGESDWENFEWGESLTLTLAVTTTTTPEQPLVLKGVKASGYADGAWTFGAATTDFSETELAPTVGEVFAVNGNKLIGLPISVGSQQKMPGNLVMFHRPNLSHTDGKYYPDLTGNCKIMTPDSQLDYKLTPSRCGLPVHFSNYFGYVGEGGLLIKNLPETDAFTIEFWVYQHTDETDKVGGAVLVHSGADESIDIVTTKQASDYLVTPIYKAWFHLAITHEAGAGFTREYINGVFNGESEFKGMPILTWNEEGWWESTGEYTGKIGGNGDSEIEFVPGAVGSGTSKYFDEVVIWDKVIYDANGFTPPSMDKPYNI